MPVNKDDALRFFNTDEIRIVEICNRHKWFIVPFIAFQYVELSENNRAHNSVIQILKKYNLFPFKPLTSPLQAAIEQPQEQEQEHEHNMNIDQEHEHEHDIEVEDDNLSILVRAFENATGIMGGNNEKSGRAYSELLKMKVTPEEIQAAVEVLSEKGYTITGPWSLKNTIINNRLGSKHSKAEIMRRSVEAEGYRKAL